jgi:protein-S-isoprenylcysteine O-methyltransferase Ste14
MALQEEFEQQGNWLFKYRGYLPVFILLAGIIIHIRTELNPEISFLKKMPYEFYYETGCLLVSLFGLFIRAYTIGYKAANTSGRNTFEGQIAESLNTAGSYSIVRHPLYLGNFFMWLGIALLIGCLWFIIFFCLSYCIYYERIMFSEEQFLRRKFGSVYTQWAEKTPAFFPKFRLFLKPSLSFNWKRVLRQEKNGFVALFLLFAGFDIIGEWVKKQNHYNYFLLVTCIISIVSYFILKYLKYKTEVLNEVVN